MTPSNAMAGPPPVSRPGAPPGEAALVRRLRAGEEDAFEELVRGYTGRLLGLSRRILSNSEEARDVVQETFLAAFQSFDRFRGDAALGTWLSRIAVNHCLMRLRTRRRKPEKSIEELLPEFLPDGHAVRASVRWDVSFASEVERKEMFLIIRGKIDDLPSNYRTVLLLRDIEELSTEEVAKMLGVSTNTVKVRLHRARQALKGLLEPHFRPS